MAFVIFISTFGATNRYRDQEVMKKTLRAFLYSLSRQTSKQFKVFIGCHDDPMGFIQEDWVAFLDIVWCSLAVPGDESFEYTKTMRVLPRRAKDSVSYENQRYNCILTDMGRKTYHASKEACAWAYRGGIRDFWLVRVDSDDLLAIDFVEELENTDTEKIGAVFTRKCHMFDIGSGKFGIYDYPHPATCNSLHMRISDSGLVRPSMFYHCNDHTRFASMAVRSRIPFEEKHWKLCVLTNTGNSISGRPPIEEEEYAKEIPLTDELIDRYGLGILMEQRNEHKAFLRAV